MLFFEEKHLILANTKGHVKEQIFHKRQFGRPFYCTISAF